MSAAKAIYGKLSTTAEVTALLGKLKGSPCIFPAKAILFTAFPLIAYEVTEGTNEAAFDGSSGLSSHNMTLSCVGLTHDDAETLADAVVPALNGQSGTWGGQDVQGSFVENVEDAEEVVIDEDRIVWRKEVQILIWIEA